MLKVLCDYSTLSLLLSFPWGAKKRAALAARLSFSNSTNQIIDF